MERIGFRANGLTFRALRSSGPDPDRRILCLHGFPDHAGSWRPVAERLVGAGWTVVAPWMRGYAPTQSAPDGDYTLAALARDVVEILDALDWNRAVVLGHDWGAAAAYAAANYAPDRVRRVVGVSVPPLGLFVRNLLRHPNQFRRSLYVVWFQLPGVAEYLLASDDYRALRAAGPSDDEVEIDWEAGLLETFRSPGKRIGGSAPRCSMSPNQRSTRRAKCTVFPGWATSSRSNGPIVWPS